MTRTFLLERMRAHPYAVQCSASPDGKPQAAVVGVAISDAFEVVFDTTSASRKCDNLTRDGRISLVMGSTSREASWTVQLDGVADQPTGADRARLVALYLSVFPDGVERQQWPGLTYFRVSPRWIRWSNFLADPPEVLELDMAALEQLT